MNESTTSEEEQLRDSSESAVVELEEVAGAAEAGQPNADAGVCRSVRRDVFRRSRRFFLDVELRGGQVSSMAMQYMQQKFYGF